MGIAVSFRGRSGKAWEFQRVAADAPWARSPGVHDLQPIWALAEAERYGANAVFLALEFDAATRSLMANDIEEGFSTVCFTDHSRKIAA